MLSETITQRMLYELEREVRTRMQSERFSHTLGTAAMASQISDIYAPTLSIKVRAAALLHDVTKEYSYEKQLKTCEKSGIILREDEKDTPTIHAITAAALIPVEFVQFSDPVIIGAVRWHSTGRAGMTLAERIVCFADYIENGREYPDCVFLRELFWSAQPGKMVQTDKLKLLDNAMLKMFQNNVSHLRAEGKNINIDSLKAIEYLTY